MAADLVVSATGVRPDSRLADCGGLGHRDGRIVVDEHMHTSARNVYAAGDVALAHNITAGRRIPSRALARRRTEGRVAGLIAAGYRPAGTQYPEFSFAIGDQMLKYRGLGHRITKT